MPHCDRPSNDARPGPAGAPLEIAVLREARRGRIAAMQDLSGKTVIVFCRAVWTRWLRRTGAAGRARIVALTVDYNQRHRVELDSAARIATAVGAAEHIVLPLDLRRFGEVGADRPASMPKDGVGEDIPVTYVPARNLIFLSLTLGLAEARQSPDLHRRQLCARLFEISRLPPRIHRGLPASRAARDARRRQGVDFTIHAATQHMTKADIAAEAARLGMDAGMSWSCYDPTPGAALQIAEDPLPPAPQGLRRRGLADPTRYAVEALTRGLCGQGNIPDAAGRARRPDGARSSAAAGCNLWTGREQDRAKAICKFCDADFVGTDGTLGGKYADAAALAERIGETWGRRKMTAMSC